MQPAQAALVNELLRLDLPTITVALRTPFDLQTYPQAQTHICVYDILDPTMHALAAALWGHMPFTGRLPVTLGHLYPFGHGLSL
jgi:beta-N-acetylhexosaminidase